MHNQEHVNVNPHCQLHHCMKFLLNLSPPPSSSSSSASSCFFCSAASPRTTLSYTNLPLAVFQCFSHAMFSRRTFSHKSAPLLLSLAPHSHKQLAHTHTHKEHVSMSHTALPCTTLSHVTRPVLKLVQGNEVKKPCPPLRWGCPRPSAWSSGFQDRFYKILMCMFLFITVELRLQN